MAHNAVQFGVSAFEKRSGRVFELPRDPKNSYGSCRHRKPLPCISDTQPSLRFARNVADTSG